MPIIPESGAHTLNYVQYYFLNIFMNYCVSILRVLLAPTTDHNCSFYWKDFFNVISSNFYGTHVQLFCAHFAAAVAFNGVVVKRRILDKGKKDEENSFDKKIKRDLVARVFKFV